MYFYVVVLVKDYSKEKKNRWVWDSCLIAHNIH